MGQTFEPGQNGDAGLIARFMQIERQVTPDRLPWEFRRNDRQIVFRVKRSTILSGNGACLGLSIVALLAIWVTALPVWGEVPRIGFGILALWWVAYLIRTTHISQWDQYSLFLIDTEAQSIVTSPSTRFLTKRIPIGSIESFLCCHEQGADDDRSQIDAVLYGGERITLPGNLGSRDATENGTRALGFLCDKPVFVSATDDKRKRTDTAP